MSRHTKVVTLRRTTEVSPLTRTGYRQNWCEASGCIPCVFLARFVRVCRLSRQKCSYEVPVNLFEQTTMVLEWPRLLEALAGHARSTMGAARCRALELATCLQDSQQRQQETTEMAQLQASGEALPALAFPDIRDPLARAKKGAVLEILELRDCRIVLELLEESGRFVGRHQADATSAGIRSACLAVCWGAEANTHSVGYGDPFRWLDQGVSDTGVAALEPSGALTQTTDTRSSQSDAPLAPL